MLIKLNGNLNDSVKHRFNKYRLIERGEIGVVDAYVSIAEKFNFPECSFKFTFGNKDVTFNHKPHQYKNSDEFKNVVRKFLEKSEIIISPERFNALKKLTKIDIIHRGHFEVDESSNAIEKLLERDVFKNVTKENFPFKTVYNFDIQIDGDFDEYLDNIIKLGDYQMKILDGKEISFEQFKGDIREYPLHNFIKEIKNNYDLIDTMKNNKTTKCYLQKRMNNKFTDEEIEEIKDLINFKIGEFYYNYIEKWKNCFSHEKIVKIEGSSKIFEGLSALENFKTYYEIKDAQDEVLTLKVNECNNKICDDTRILSNINKFIEDAPMINIKFNANDFNFYYDESVTKITSPLELTISYQSASNIEKLFGIPNGTIMEPKKEYIFNIKFDVIDVLVYSNLTDGPIFRLLIDKIPTYIKTNQILYVPFKNNKELIDNLSLTFKNSKTTNKLNILVHLKCE